MSVTMAGHSGHGYHFYIRSRFNLDAWHEKQSFLMHACLAWGIGFLLRMVLKGCHDFLPSLCVVSGAVRTAALVQGPNGQSASFRKMRFSSPEQTSSNLTEKRILCRHPHGKAHSASPPYPFRAAASRKSAVCSPQVGQSASFREVRLQTEICGP